MPEIFQSRELTLFGILCLACGLASGEMTAAQPLGMPPALPPSLSNALPQQYLRQSIAPLEVLTAPPQASLAPQAPAAPQPAVTAPQPALTAPLQAPLASGASAPLASGVPSGALVFFQQTINPTVLVPPARKELPRARVVVAPRIIAARRAMAQHAWLPPPGRIEPPLAARRAIEPPRLAENSWGFAPPQKEMQARAPYLDLDITPQAPVVSPQTVASPPRARSASEPSLGAIANRPVKPMPRPSYGGAPSGGLGVALSSQTASVPPRGHESVQARRRNFQAAALADNQADPTAEWLERRAAMHASEP